MEHKEETKICQNCKKDFIIEPDDFSFYEKIKVPSPTFCPECRMVRRMIWRNCRSLFKRECGNCSKSIISMYHESDIYNPYCMDCWNNDNRDPFIIGRDYDFSKNFFVQLSQFFKEAPILYVHHTGMVIRSDFTNYSYDDKDCYLSYSVIGCENVLYSENIDKSKNNIDCDNVQKIENCSYNIDCESNYNCHYANKSHKCIDSYFIYDCINCQNCCLSSNLHNKQYVFKNKQLSKDEYIKEILNLSLDSYSGLQSAKKYFDHMFREEAIHRFAQIYNSQNSTGDYIGNSKNVTNSFSVQNSENIYNSYRVILNSKDSYDNQGLGNGELVYESIATSLGTYRDLFCYICIGSKECEYSFMCKNCTNCFGCSGLNNSQYCILNKQYTKEQYFEMVNKIKEQMIAMPYVDKKGNIYKYGEFFPFDMSPFGYNETNANDCFPITKDEAIANGYPWREIKDKKYSITTKSEDLLDNIKDIDELILKEVISCPNNGDQKFMCSTAYRILPEELQFYKHKGLPLPRFCPNCRHCQRLEYRNPLRLYSRVCSNNCGAEFKTSYSPDKLYKIYCDKCYQKEVV